MSKAIRDLVVGDAVLYQTLNPERAAREGWTVTRLARKWGYAQGAYGHEVKFSLDSGYEDGGQYVSPGRILTDGMLEEESRQRAARTKLRDLGVDFRFGAQRFSADALDAVVEILAADVESDQ